MSLEETIVAAQLQYDTPLSKGYIPGLVATFNLYLTLSYKKHQCLDPGACVRLGLIDSLPGNSQPHSLLLLILVKGQGTHCIMYWQV